MARSLNGTTQYLEIKSAVLTAAPMTLASWFMSSAPAHNQRLIWLGNRLSEVEWVDLGLDSAANTVITTARHSTSGIAYSTASFTPDVWQHACAVHVTAASRAAFLNGGAKGVNTTSIVPSGLNRTSLGRLGRASPVDYFEGSIAEAVIYNVALSDDEVAALYASGPEFVRPESIVALWRLWGQDSPEPDLYGNYPLTLVGSPPAADHVPGVWYPSGPIYVPAPAGGGVNPSLFLRRPTRATRMPGGGIAAGGE